MWFCLLSTLMWMLNEQVADWFVTGLLALDYTIILREPVRKKIRDFLGVFPIRGGVSPNPKTFVILTIALKNPLKHPKTP